MADDKLKELKDKAEKDKPSEADKLARKTIHAEKGKIMFGSVEEEVDIITETDPNATGGYDVNIHLPFCPIASVTNQ